MKLSRAAEERQRRRMFEAEDHRWKKLLFPRLRLKPLIFFSTVCSTRRGTLSGRRTCSPT
ncbi:hypothetical protein MES4922_280044 [Mesorhizobium ventifaucium]|uniref:Uncharacterized protein n=1 Tax=Mesorhizobium ventifaucium TaxID=666020 RepID=A0ABM9DW97_9HYPH|nr:hypothetical protein MES4922_280044 [Mesorhizobium ventifaucium]